MGWFVLFSAFFIPLLLWGIVSPRSQWRTLSAWKFRYPEANEPSDTAYAVSRFASVFSLVVWIMVLVGVVGQGGRDVNRPRTATASQSTHSASPTGHQPAPGPELPISGYHAAPSRPDDTRTLGIVIHTAKDQPTGCRPQAEILSENATQVEVAAVLESTPLSADRPFRSCSSMTTARVSDYVFLVRPLGGRALVTRGPFADPAGRIHDDGRLRTLRPVPRPP